MIRARFSIGVFDFVFEFAFLSQFCSRRLAFQSGAFLISIGPRIRSATGVAPAPRKIAKIKERRRHGTKLAYPVRVGNRDLRNASAVGSTRVLSAAIDDSVQ